MDRGSWRIYIGAAPGVGTTYAMLEEGRRRAERGARVVIGCVDTHDRPGTVAQLAGLERAPGSQDTEGGQLDVDAVLLRQPDVCLVDDLAGGSGTPRWLAVERLLAAGTDVVSTLGVEHLASLQDVVDGLLGPTPRATVPDEVIRRADQIQLVDMTPEALRRRLAHGNVVRAEAMDAGLADRFRPDVLAALRRLALLWVADQLEDPPVGGLAPGSRPVEARERVVVTVTGAPGGDRVVRRAARLAGRLGGDLVGVHVRRTAGAEDGGLAARRDLLEDLGGRYVEVVSGEVASALLGVARSEGATQLVLGRSRRSWFTSLRSGSVISDVLRQAGPIDVHITADPGHDEDRVEPAVLSRGLTVLSRRRRSWAWAAAVLLPPITAAGLVPFRDRLDLSTVLLALLAVAVAAAAVGGIGPGLAAATAGFLLANWFFTQPTGTLTIAEPEHLVALLLALAVAAAVGVLVGVATRRSAEATRARGEAVALARAAATTVDADPLGALVELVRLEVGAQGVALLARDDDSRWILEAGAGTPPPTAPTGPGDEGVSVPVGADAVLVVDAPGLTPSDVSLLTALAAQLASARTGRDLAKEASTASALAAANDLRGAILNAASHDLRTPLASIKAAVSSLLATDVRWDAESQADFLATIDAETDRLTGVLTNLLDLSRLQAGAVVLQQSAVSAEEVVASALASLGLHGDARIDVDVAETLPDVLGDAGLLERVVANLVQNALRHSHAGVVRVLGSVVGAHLVLRVVDQGPGVARADRDRIFEAFERAGEAGGTGLGLGLAVSRGFVQAHGGTLAVEDTPGGGCTMVVELPLAE